MSSLPIIEEMIRERKRTLFWATIFFMVTFLCGCSIEKKADNAIDLVNTKTRWQERVVGPYLDAHPRDTTPKIILGPERIVEVPKLVIQADTAAIRKAKQQIIDSLKDAKDCGEAAINAYDMGYEQAEKDYQAQKQEVRCPPDTTKVYYLTAELTRAKDSLRSKDVTIGHKDGQIDQLRDTNKEQSKKITELYLWLAGIVVLAILSHVARSYIPKIKIPFSGTTGK